MRQVTSQEELDSIEKPIVVCFTNPFTCNPCRVFSPHFESAAREVTEAEFVEVDATDPANRPLVDEYLERFLTPTVILLKDGDRTEIEARTTLPLIKEVNDLLGK